MEILFTQEDEYDPSLFEKDDKINDIKVINFINSGGFGDIYKCIDSNNNICAVKAVHKFFLLDNKRKIQSIQNEMEILLMVNHPNIVSSLDSFQTDTHVIIKMELCNIDLKHFLKNNINNINTNNIIKEILQGLKYLHDKLIVHCDIKLENILVDYNGNIKICDFNLSRILKDKDELIYNKSGTPKYFSPEYILKTGHSFPADIWATGVIFYSILFNLFPFDSEEKICLCEYNRGNIIDNNIKHIFNKIFVIDMNERINADQLLEIIVD